ncbi:MAG: GNAT family N-acetyltransferase, partial [Betaproteobacteria bacterium]
ALMSRDLIESGLGWSWTQTRVSKSIANPDTLSIVLCDDDSVIGFAMMYFGDEHAHLNLLAVQPTSQRTGLGTRMIHWLEESARVAGVRAVHLEVRARNQHARRFYRRLGFLEMALLPKYYRGIEAAVWMARDLRVTTQRRVM